MNRMRFLATSLLLCALPVGASGSDHCCDIIADKFIARLAAERPEWSVDDRTSGLESGEVQKTRLSLRSASQSARVTIRCMHSEESAARFLEEWCHYSSISCREYKLLIGDECVAKRENIVAFREGTVVAEVYLEFELPFVNLPPERTSGQADSTEPRQIECPEPSSASPSGQVGLQPDAREGLSVLELCGYVIDAWHAT